MISIFSRHYPGPTLSRLCALAALISAPALTLIPGCGGNGNGGTAPIPGQNTRVVLLSASTANGQLSRYETTVDSASLISQSGNTVTLLPAHLYAEFIHMNG